MTLSMTTNGRFGRRVLGGSLMTAGLVLGVAVCVLSGSDTLDASTATLSDAAEGVATDVDEPRLISQVGFEAAPLTSSSIQTADYVVDASEATDSKIELVKHGSSSESVWLTGRVILAGE